MIRYRYILVLFISMLVLVFVCCVPADRDSVLETQEYAESSDYNPVDLFGDIRETIIHDPKASPISTLSGYTKDFGSDFALLGDWDGDGPISQVVAVGDALAAEGLNFDRLHLGAVYILFLDTAGEILSHRRIDYTTANAPAPLNRPGTVFGWSVASLGDLDGAGESVATLAIGAPGYREPGREYIKNGRAGGAVLLAYLLPDGSVLRWAVINSDTLHGPGYIKDYHWYGASLASFGDWDGRGQSAAVLAVGGPFYHSPHPSFHNTLDPTVYFHYILPDGSLLQTKRISRGTQGVPPSKPEFYSEFGDGIAFLGEEKGNAIFAVSAKRGGDLSFDQRGELYLFRLAHDLSIVDTHIINAHSHNAPPIDGTPRQRSSEWYIGPNVVSLQPLLRRNNHDISYLLSTSGATKDGDVRYIFALHEDFSIASSSKFTSDVISSMNYLQSDKLSHLHTFAYLGVLDPSAPNIHSFAVGGRAIWHDTFETRNMMIVHQSHLSLPKPKRR